MNITEASHEDAAEICRLVNSAYRGESSRKGWTTEAELLDGIRVDEDMLYEYLNDSNTSILKCTNDLNEIVGCVYLKKELERLYLGMLTVAPELQAQGIGKLLLYASEEIGREKGCKSIKMTVITNRSELINWYKRHGYNETGEIEPFPTSERFGKPKMRLEFIVLEKNI